jgi:pyrophosphatase PpaX
MLECFTNLSKDTIINISSEYWVKAMTAVIFDLDGTLLDVRKGFYWQFQELTKQYDGTPVSKEMINAAAHGTTEQIVRTLVKNTDASFEDICLRHQELRLEAYDRHLTLYDGVSDLLIILKRMGLKVGALTSGNGLTVSCLERTGIQEHFDVVISADKILRPKPHPEGLHELMERLSATPQETIMVGDSVVDVLVGKNAGVQKTVGVTHGFGSIGALRSAGADHIIHDIPSLLDVLE